MKQFVVVLRGCMASGKTTIARRMRNFDQKIVWLKVDNFKDFFSPDSDPATLLYVHGAATVTLGYLLDNRFSVVMEGVFQNPNYISDAVKNEEKHRVQSRVFELQVPLEVLKERDRTREGIKEGCRERMDDKEIERMFSVIENNPYPDAIKLDTESLSVEECIEEIMKHF